MSSAEINLRSTYRPDIDGVRALAILSVVVFHAFPDVLGGGFVGVDIFFVISGYLISGIIFKGLDAGSFSFGRFYAHRVKRIFPALLVVVFFVLVAGWLLLLPDEFKQLGKHVVGSVLYLQNFVLAGEAGYFDTASEFKPLTHMWSLAIEEQFYLFFPVLIFVAWRLGLNLLAIVVLGFVVSFFLNLHSVRVSPGVAYYLPQVRFWELLAGSALAYIDLYRRDFVFDLLSKVTFCKMFFSRPPEEEQKLKLLSNILSLAGVLLIVVSLFVIEKGYSFPGKWAVGPVLGTVLIILGGSDAWVNRVFLSSRFMVFVGLISYPLYLWHWPLLSFSRIMSSGEPSEQVRLGLVLVSVCLAWLTYRLVERPIRFGRRDDLNVLLLVLASVFLGSVSYYIYYNNGFVNRLEIFSKISKAAGEWDYPGRLESSNFNGIPYYFQRSSLPGTTIYVGDSNIEQYYPRIEQLIKSSPGATNSAIFKTGGGCLPVPGQSYGALHSHCASLMPEVYALVKGKPEIDRIVIGAQWNGYLSLGFGLASTVSEGDAAYQAILSGLSKFIREMVADGKKVYLITNIPTGKKLDPKYMARRDISAFPDVFKMRDGGVSKSDIESKYGGIRKDLIRVGNESGAVVIDPVDYLCVTHCESLDAQGNPMYKDSSHLRPMFVRDKVFFLDDTVLK